MGDEMEVAEAEERKRRYEKGMELEKEETQDRCRLTVRTPHR